MSALGAKAAPGYMPRSYSNALKEIVEDGLKDLLRLWDERRVEDVLPRAPYVQLVFTIPRIFRKAFLFKRSLHGDLSRAAYAAVRDFLTDHFPAVEGDVPAMVVAPQSFGSLLNAHPHWHALKALLENEATTEERVKLGRSWVHSGFNVDSSRRIAADDRQELQTHLEYMERSPVSMERLKYRSNGLVHSPRPPKNAKAAL